MVNMPPEVRETLEKQWPIPFATASSDGKPNVVFMGILKIKDDETLVFANNFFNKTAANLAENPRASVVCWTKDPRRSYQIKGTVTFADEGPTFEEMAESVRARKADLQM
ncbi:MAG: pyridoxamine 5'-phosphate oxidase, partial [Methanosaeta sp. SDB]